MKSFVTFCLGTPVRRGKFPYSVGKATVLREVNLDETETEAPETEKYPSRIS
jgi:hypothetical protein